METFFSYRGYRWFWTNVIGLIVLIVLYAVNMPIDGRNGGTPLGYAFGGLATLGIGYLMWFGIRKRSYAASQTTLKGCLSAHVWLGIALTLVVPLHCGFSFGWNIHTYAYAAMVITIASGIWGAITYATEATGIRSHRGGASPKKLLEQIQIVAGDIRELVQEGSDALVVLVRSIDVPFEPSLWRSLFRKRPEPIDPKTSAELLAPVPESEQGNGLKLIGLVNRKRELIQLLETEVVAQAKMKLWLYLHLPVSLGLVVLVLAHIFVVFWYW